MAELPSYPPELDASAHSSLVESLTDYALSHGITVRPQTQSEGNHLASHVPVTLFPTPLPRKNWEHALKIQRLYNLLYARVSNDPDWLGRVLSEFLLERCFLIVGYVKWTNLFDACWSYTSNVQKMELFRYNTLTCGLRIEILSVIVSVGLYDSLRNFGAEAS